MPYSSKNLIVTGKRDAVHDKRLSICLAADGFSYTELSAQGELLAYGEAVGSHTRQLTETTRDIRQFFAEVGIRPLGFRQMDLVVCSDESVWVPDEVYNAASGRAFLRLVGGNSVNVLSAPCREIASTSVFSADDVLTTAFKVALPGLTVTNQHIRMASCAKLSGERSLLLTHWRNGHVDIAAFRDGRYLYGHTLGYTEEGPLAYQLVEIVRTFGLEASRTVMLMCGDVDRRLFAMLRPFFPQVELFTGTAILGDTFKSFHSYRHALLLI